MKKSNVRDYYPKNYADSRSRFTKTVAQLSKPCETGHWKIDSAKDTDLFVDYAWLPPAKNPDKLLVLISGIHGSETYAGAAILNLFIEEILPQVNRDHLGIFMAHAMNPYGFKYHTRCTENEVNLNRNFSVSGELFKTKNPDSTKMNAAFMSRQPVASWESKLLKSLRRENNKIFFGDFSMEELTKGISPGQFERADDLEYGGKSLEPQTKALIEKMKSLMPNYKDVLALDLHTGLGDPARLHLLTDGLGKSLDPELFHKLFKPDEDKEFYAFTPAETEGFYPVFGATNGMFADLAADDQRVCAITLEFGTIGHGPEQQVEGWNQFLVEHEGHHYGYANPKIKEEVETLNFLRSYPDDDHWRKSVLTASEGLLLRVLQRSGCL